MLALHLATQKCRLEVVNLLLDSKGVKEIINAETIVSKDKFCHQLFDFIKKLACLKYVLCSGGISTRQKTSDFLC
jgi:hypothetical protein